MDQPVIFVVGKPIEEAVPGFLRRGGDSSREIGGYVTYLRAHLRAAIAAGYEPHVFTVGRRARLEDTGLGFVHSVAAPPVPPRQNMIPLLGPAVRRAVVHFARSSRARPLLHSFQVWGGVGVAVAEEPDLRRRGAATITTFFTTYEHEARAKTAVARHIGRWAGIAQQAELAWIRLAVNRLEEAGYRRSDFAVTNYNSVQRLLASSYGPRPMVKLSYAPETAFVDDSPVPRPAVPLPAGNPAAPLIVAASRHDPRKALHVLIEALGLLRGRNVDFRACLLGGGPLLGFHRDLVARLGLDDRVVVTGNVPDPRAFLEQADVFALPSLEEGSGSMSLLEAMQSRLAPVVSAVDGLPEDVESGVNGLLVPPGDAAALAGALERLLCDDALRRRLASAARATYETRFAAQRLVDDLGNLYAQALRRTSE